MSTWRGALPGGLGLLVVASVLALLLLPGGDLTSDGSSYSVSRHGYRLGLEILQELGYDARPYPHGVETLPDGVTLWVLDPGDALLDDGPAGMGAVREWVASGNTLLLALSGGVGTGPAPGASREELRQRVLRGIEERGGAGAEDPEPADPPPTDEEALLPRGTGREALDALGLRRVAVAGARLDPYDVGFDDPFAVRARLPGIASLRGVRDVPVLVGEGLADGEVLLTAEHGAVIWRTALGEGQVVLLSDARLLCNWALVAEDNAMLLVDLAELTAGDAPLLVEEFSHGYASVTTLARLLVRPPVALVTVQVALVLAVGLLWRTRRFGPPIPAPREERRDRAEHVRALADLHRRARHGAGAAARLRADLVGRVRRRMGGGAAADERALVAWLAARLGQPEPRVRQDLEPPEENNERALLRYARRLERIRRTIEERR